MLSVLEIRTRPRASSITPLTLRRFFIYLDGRHGWSGLQSPTYMQSQQAFCPHTPLEKQVKYLHWDTVRPRLCIKGRWLTTWTCQWCLPWAEDRYRRQNAQIYTFSAEKNQRAEWQMNVTAWFMCRTWPALCSYLCKNSSKENKKPIIPERCMRQHKRSEVTGWRSILQLFITDIFYPGMFPANLRKDNRFLWRERCGRRWKTKKNGKGTGSYNESFFPFKT